CIPGTSRMRCSPCAMTSVLNKNRGGLGALTAAIIAAPNGPTHPPYRGAEAALGHRCRESKRGTSEAGGVHEPVLARSPCEARAGRRGNPCESRSTSLHPHLSLRGREGASATERTKQSQVWDHP